MGLLRRIDGRLDRNRSRVGLSRGPRTLSDGLRMK